MKVKCPISGVSYEIDFPDFGTSVSPHPMLAMKATELNETYLKLSAAQTFSPKLTHLLGLSYLCKLPLVELPSLPSSSAESFHSFWLKHLEKLAKLATRIETRPTSRKLPKIRVTLENLPNISSWLDDISYAIDGMNLPIDGDKVRKLNASSYKTIKAKAEDSSRSVAFYSDEELDELILRGLKGSLLTKRESAAFPTLMADWTSAIAPFPTAKLVLPSGKKVTIATYWHSLVEKAFKSDGVLDLFCEDTNVGDIEELLEHCYENVPCDAGIRASVLWEKLEELKTSLTNYKLNPPDRKPKAPKIPSFKGSTDDLLALLGEETSAPTDISVLLGDAPESKVKQTTISLQAKLAAILKK